ncbi:STAS domain-containing protein [Streptomyces sp. NPDC054783]
MAETLAQSAPRPIERAVGGTTVVELRGEIDILAAPPRLLCRARNRVMARHGRLRLVTYSGRSLRILRGAGLEGVFEIHDHLPETLAGACGRSLPAAVG